MPLVPHELRQEMLAWYANGDTIETIARAYGRQPSTVRKSLVRWGATMRSRGPQRVLDVDEHYFDTIDSEEKAYWLGFLIADGSVLRNGKGLALSLVLQTRDASHIQKFKTALASEAPITTRNEGKHTGITIYSTAMCRALSALECYRKKSTVHGTPVIRADLLRHMYRGWFDGDGHLSYAPAMHGWTFAVIGSPTFLTDFQRWLSVTADVGFTKVIVRGPVIMVRYNGGPQIARIMHVLYDGATIYLDRKHETYQALLRSRRAA